MIGLFYGMVFVGIPGRFIACIRLISPHIPAFPIAAGKELEE